MEAPEPECEPGRREELDAARGSRYERLQERYQALLEKYQGAVVQRSHSHWLGSWLIHQNHNGVALIAGNRIRIANRRFYELAAPRTRWQRLDRECEPASLAEVLLHVAGELPNNCDRRTEFCLRKLGSPLCVLEVCVDRLAQDPEQIAAVVRDVTDRELLRHQHEEAAQRDQFMAILAHELRNPLSPIITSAELIHRTADTEAIRRAAEIILRQAQHQARLVDDLLDTARVRQGKIVLRRERRDLRELAREAAEATEKHRQHGEIGFALELPDEPVWADVDPTRLVQCLVNLLVNASKFTLAGGSNRLRIELDGEIAWLRVRDDGIGIDPPMLGRIFELFTQADDTLHRTHGGLGIGLPLVRKLIELHGGGIRADSEGLGCGSQFSLWLPIAQPDGAEAAEAPGAPPAAEISASGKVVLVVEDNSDARETLCDLLAASGVVAIPARDGPEALAAARKLRPQVVVSDIGLPGFDGFELACRLRAEMSGLYLVALSGYSQPEDRRRAEAAGFNAYLVKPVDFSALLRLIAGE